MRKVKLKSNIIKDILAKKNLSQNWLADRIGITSGFMSQIVNGKKNLSPQTRKRFLRYFKDYKFNDLFEIKESE